MSSSKHRRPPGRGNITTYVTSTGQKLWRVRLTVNGRSVVRQGYTSRRQADDAITALRQGMQDGTLDRPRRTVETVEDLLADYIDVAAPLRGWKQSTVRAHRASAKVVTRHTRLGRMRAGRLERRDVQQAYADLAASGYSSATMGGVHTLLRMAFAAAVHDGTVTHDPTTTLTAPKGQERYRDHRVKAWDAPTLRTFLDATAHQVGHHVAGRRCHRATPLRTDRAVTGPPKSEESVRTIQLDAGTVAALRTHRARIGEERLALGIGPLTGTSWVFLNQRMRHYRHTQISHQFTAQVQRLGLPPLTLHGLRHTHASTLLAAGVSPVAVAQRLGHQSVSTTLSTYAWALAEQRQQAAEMMRAILTG